MTLGFSLYVIMAITAALAAFLGTDEAAKYIEPEHLFWWRGLNGVAAAVALTLKGYTSQAFSDWRAERKSDKPDATTPKP
jgi:hypothetical protein